MLPIGRLSAHRMVAAPAFAAAAAFAVVWAPEPERLPTVVGVTALVAAVAAGVARALDVQGDEALRVWIVVGVGLFLVTGAGALLHADPQRGVEPAAARGDAGRAVRARPSPSTCPTSSSSTSNGWP